jgi:hypothetical protein
MRIHALTLTCDRDQDLSILMMKTFAKHCPIPTTIKVFNTDHNESLKGYGNGAGWEASMMKLACLRNLNPDDSDFVLSVDSDVVFTSPEVFKYIKPEYGIIGIQHQQPYATRYGNWGHMSGALIFIRGDVLKRMCALSVEELNMIRFNHFKPFNITENEDVVLSYLAKFAAGSLHGATNDFDLGSVPGLSSGDFEGDLSPFSKEPCDNELCSCPHHIGKGFKCFASHVKRKSFYHLNYCPTSFLGEPVTGKWDIPKVLEMKGIKL